MRKEVLSDTVTLYFGDSREMVPTLGTIDCIVSDPPYGMSFLSRASEATGRHDRIVGDDTDELLIWACNLKPRHSSYLFCRWDNLYGARLPKPTSVLTWIKPGGSMGDLEHEHSRSTEIALFYPGPEHYWPGKRPFDVMENPTTGNIHHPTEKPVALMSHVIQFTAGVVVDPFMGSGSTGVAAASLGRSFIGIEVDPKHFDTACRRISESLKQEVLF